MLDWQQMTTQAQARGEKRAAWVETQMPAGAKYDKLAVRNAATQTEMLAFVVDHIAGLERRIAELEARPTLKYCGLYEHKTYPAGSAVTFGGSLFVAEHETLGPPETPNSGWRLAVKRGKDANGR